MTEHMRRAYMYLGGKPQLQRTVGAQWNNGAVRLGCQDTILTTPCEPTHYPDADPVPDWPVMSVSTDSLAELMVLLVGLASIDRQLELQRNRRDV